MIGNSNKESQNAGHVVSLVHGMFLSKEFKIPRGNTGLWLLD